MADLSKEGRLLITSDPRDGNRRAEQIALAINFAGGTDLRQYSGWHTEDAEQLFVPISSANVEEHCAGGIARISHVLPSASEIPDEPGIDRAKSQLSSLGPGFRIRNVIENPLQLRCGEISINDQAGFATDRIRQSAGL